MLGKYRTDLLLLLHNLPLLITLHIGINALHGDAPSILFPTSLVLLSTSELPNCRHSMGDSIRALFELFDRIDKMSSSHAQYQCS
jgi:hypothetical protein